MNYIAASSKQQQDWEYHHTLILEGGSPETMIIDLQKPGLDSDALLFSLRMLVHRHESLRTSFREIDEVLYQCIHPYVENDIVLDSIDRSMHQPSPADFQHLIAEKGTSCGDLQSYPLIRSLYIILPGKERLFLLIFPHIICDQHSLRLIKQELSLFYKSKINPGIHTELPSAPLQLRQYTARRIADQARNSRKDINFWKSSLELQPPDFMPSCPNHVFAVRIGKVESATLKLIICDGIGLLLRKLAAQTHTSPSTVLYAAYILAYSLFSGKDRILLASPAMDRSRPAHQQIIGNLMGGIYLFMSHAPDETILQWLQRVSLSFLHAMRHIIFRHSDLGLDTLDLCNRCDLFCYIEPTPIAKQVYDKFTPGHFLSGDRQLYKLNTTSFIFEDRLLLVWSYHRKFYSRSAMEELVQIHEKILTRLATCPATTKLADLLEQPLISQDK
jgi:hypothetical protein